jgi:hypothetical protein
VYSQREDQGFDLEIPEVGKKTLKDKVIAFFSHEPSWYWKYYKMECVYLGILLVCVANFFRGKELNNKIAFNWRKTAIPSLF